jgi:hypothetical protein
MNNDFVNTYVICDDRCWFKAHASPFCQTPIITPLYVCAFPGLQTSFGPGLGSVMRDIGRLVNRSSMRKLAFSAL